MPCRSSSFLTAGYARGSGLAQVPGQRPHRGHSPDFKREPLTARHSLASHRGGEAAACDDQRLLSKLFTLQPLPRINCSFLSFANITCHCTLRLRRRSNFFFHSGLCPRFGHSPKFQAKGRTGGIAPDFKRRPLTARHSLASHRGGEAAACNDQRLLSKLFTLQPLLRINLFFTQLS